MLKLSIEKLIIEPSCQPMCMDIEFQDFGLIIKNFEVFFINNQLDIRFPSVWNPATMRDDAIVSFNDTKIELYVKDFIEKYIVENNLLEFLNKNKEID